MSEQTDYQLDDLLYLMARLRDADSGCPWDIDQDFASIVPSTIEELYEVVELIEAERYSELPAELGDLLFQIVFYAQLGREQGLFEFADVVQSITEKLLRRHPHVFVDGQLYGRRRQGPPPTAAQLSQQWRQIKAAERAQYGAPRRSPALWGELPAGLPALAAAQKLTAEAAHLGFDWPDEAGPMAKIAEELAELRDEVAAGDQPRVAEEYGDLLLAVVNLGRHLQVDAEQALRSANDKFRLRFTAMVAATEAPLAPRSIDAWQALWEQVKASE
ncbi:nucleoside triphosphate pyrophosphohydrolase [Gammaproteobacteria bacterium LSUCC0057]|uniref:Nucleoside triphosphate pyrophosphohydrolase n=1 Tax=Gammaproteobacteria bacterium LSUCC0057 TaxID=2559237 RepID=A0A4Y8UI57_9GAMM|nr:nucleoside triphosphate pyrophosphohydrolase [Gammaproteobacteria bacterium LSUCC0057]